MKRDRDWQRVSIARCLTRLVVGRELAEALSDCDEALKLQPDNVQTRETRGFVFLKLGETDKAAARALMPGVNRQFASYGVK